MTAALARAADREVDARKRAYPALIERGEIGREQARVDIEAWEAIAMFLRYGQVPLPGGDMPQWERARLPVWRPLLEALREALKRRDADAAARPADAAILARRDNVAAIHSIFVRVAAAFEPESVAA